MFGIGLPELAIVLVIAVVVFGVGKLPEIGGAVGKTMKNFKKEIKNENDNEPKIEITKEITDGKEITK